MPHQRGKRSLEARERRKQEKSLFNIKPTFTRYPPFYQRKKFYPVSPESTQKLTVQQKDALRCSSKRCKICGWNHYPEALIIHHIDKNTRNNQPCNLVVLCRNCHYLLHKGLTVLPKEEKDGS